MPHSAGKRDKARVWQPGYLTLPLTHWVTMGQSLSVLPPFPPVPNGGL